MDEQLFRKLSDFLDVEKEHMVEILSGLVAIPAINPLNGGKGELEKMEYIVSVIEKYGLTDYVKMERYDVKDGDFIRPNLVLRVKGKDSSRGAKWGLVHIDIVPSGDISKWNSDPYKLERKGDMVFGRGTEDNGQAIVGMLMALAAMKNAGVVPERDVALAIVSDEETGSEKGLKYLIKRGIFKEGDEFLVPDSGSPTSEDIEIAEKSILWLKVQFRGYQAHASRPNKGVNSTSLANEFSDFLVKTLYSKFGETDPLFSPPESTFTPTRVYSTSADATNIIPDSNVREFDFRVLPRYRLDDILGVIEEIKQILIKKYTNRELGEKGVPSIEIEVLNRLQSAPPTPENSNLIQELKRIIRAVYNVEPKAVGIGGGTFAGILRGLGYHAAVWSTIYGNAHIVNESASIRNMVNDSKVFAYWFSS